MQFSDRIEAGEYLAQEIEKKQISQATLLCIPRGGVVVGERIASRLGIPLDIVVPRKIGSPLNREVALGAVAQDGSTFLNEELITMLGIAGDDIEDIIDREIMEIKRRMTQYRGSYQYPDYTGHTIILVDDGAATGYTMLAAAGFVRETLKPDRLIIALPVAPPDLLELFKIESDEVIFLHAPEDFQAVGQFYRNFEQTTDGEVLAILQNYGPGSNKT